MTVTPTLVRPGEGLILAGAARHAPEGGPMAHPKAYPTDQTSPRPGGFLCLGCVPGPTPRPRHGPECIGRACPCTCRAVLGLAGPFDQDDPFVPTISDQLTAGLADHDTGEVA